MSSCPYQVFIYLQEKIHNQWELVSWQKKGKMKDRIKETLTHKPKKMETKKNKCFERRKNKMKERKINEEQRKKEI